MTFRERTLYRVLTGPLAALMLVLSVAVPVVERADVSHELAVETRHDADTCPRPHDHTVCTQVGANRGALSDGPEHRVAPVTLQLAAPDAVPVSGPAAFAAGPPSRAPPTA